LNNQPLRDYSRLAAALVVAGLVIGVVVFGSSYFGPVKTTTRTVTVSQSSVNSGNCSAASDQSSPLNTFNVYVYYQSQWNATVKGYTYGATTPAFTTCYEGNGDGVISINGWVQNPTGGQTLNATIQKEDGSNSNLTATLGGIRQTTTAPFGSVKVFGTAVP